MEGKNPSGKMKLLAFLEVCPDEAVRIITEHRYALLDPKDFEGYQKSFKANYIRAGWREALGIMETNEVPADLIKEKFEDLSNNGLPAEMILPPGFTVDTVLQKFSLGLINVLLHIVLENGGGASRPGELTSLQAQIDLVSKIWKHVKTRSGNERVITLEEESKLREALDSSIIDGEALIVFLKDKDQITSMLKTDPGQINPRLKIGQYL